MTRSEKGLILILILVGALGFFYFKGMKVQKQLWAQEDNRRMELENIYFNAFGKMKLEGKSAIIFDDTKQEPVFSLNSKDVFPMASIVKVMTGIVALESMPKESIVTIPSKALAQEGDTGLLSGEKWKLEDLVALMLTVSSNDAAMALALDHGGDPSSFVEAMNKRAADLGFDNTHFSNMTGLDLSDHSPGAVSSAEDIAKMIFYGFSNHQDVFMAAAKAENVFLSESGMEHNVKNTNDLLSSLSNILASKTGFTDLAGGNLAVVFKTLAGKVLSAVILGSTLEGRFKDMENLIRASSKYLGDLMSRASMDGARPDFDKSNGKNS